MKDKSIKQPWPRSARVTVWVLGVALLATTVGMGVLYEKVQEYDAIDMPDIEELKQNPPDYEVFEPFR